MKLYKSLKSAILERENVEAIKLTLDGIFPPELFYFTHLKELYLEGVCAEFPKIGMSWLSLKTLSLKCHSFSGNFSQVFCLPSLENLKIIETPIKQFILPLGFAPAPLKSVTFKSCELAELPEEISMLSLLQEMNLTGNNLTKLPESFYELRHLKRLNLDQNKFSHFPKQIKKMPNLAHLSIDGNLFSQDEKDRIQREFHITPH